jgi:hypothetical protein
METRGGILQPTSRRVFQIDPGEDSIVAVNFSTRPKTIRVRVMLDSIRLARRLFRQRGGLLIARQRQAQL